MNKRILELAEQANETFSQQVGEHGSYYFNGFAEKFAELIVLKCIEQGKQIQSQSVSNGSEEYNTGREMGIEVFLNQIKKHFGVE